MKSAHLTKPRSRKPLLWRTDEWDTNCLYGTHKLGFLQVYNGWSGIRFASSIRGTPSDEMKSQQEITLAVCRWAAWAPGVTETSSWHAWAEGVKSINGPVAPDVQFVAPLMRRRLSGLSRMVFRVAVDCLANEEQSVAYVFCSRYGEYNRSYAILTDLANGGPASAAAFSNSVHNTSASLFAIEKQDTSQSTAMAGGEATLETAFMEAWSLLSDGIAPAVLVVYHDEPLPELYRGQPTTVLNSAAFGMLLRLPAPGREAINLRLSWHPHEVVPAEPCSTSDPALQVLGLLLKDGVPVTLDTERLVWTWSTSDEAV